MREVLGGSQGDIEMAPPCIEKQYLIDTAFWRGIVTYTITVREFLPSLKGWGSLDRTIAP